MVICKGCGAGLRYDPQKQKLVCDYCGSEYTAQEYKDAPGVLAQEQTLTPEEEEFFKDASGDANVFHEKKEDGTFEAKLMTCPQCGGQLLTTDETVATFCNFCGASVVLKSQIVREKKPSYIIPFGKSKEDCEKAYRGALKKAIYAPSSMAKEEQIERFRGIYMPYWVYSFEKKSGVNISGKRETRKGDYIHTKHYNIRTDVEAFYDGIAYDASSSFSDNLSEAIAPFDYHEAREFDPSYLSGFYADTNDVPSYVYQKDASEVASEHAADSLRRSFPFGSYDVDQTDLENQISLDENKPKLAMYPVWFLATRNKKGDRVSYAVVNGQTGEVAADLPIDAKKMLIGTLLLAIPIFLILNLALTFTPTAALVLTMILGVVGLVLANRQLNRAYCKEQKLDDKGYLSNHEFWEEAKHPEKKKPKSAPAVGMGFIIVILILAMSIIPSIGFGGSGLITIVIFMVMMCIVFVPSQKKNKNSDKPVSAAPMKEKIGVLWKPLVGMIASLVILIAHPVSDLYYYGAAIVAMVFVAWSFVEIIRTHNKMSTRPLPQFDRRGGDENGLH